MTTQRPRGRLDLIEARRMLEIELTAWQLPTQNRKFAGNCINNVATDPRLRHSSTLSIRKEFKMRVIVKKWGNSAAVRIPAAIMEAASLSLNETVDVREESGCIVIEPIRPSEYDLAQLLAGITPENLHAEVSFGPAVGKEAF